MHITDHLQPCCVALRQQADSLPAAIHQLVELVQKSGCLTDTVQFEQDVLEREKMGGICMGRGLAIPHAKSAGVAHAELAALTLAGAAAVFDRCTGRCQRPACADAGGPGHSAAG